MKTNRYQWVWSPTRVTYKICRGLSFFFLSELGMPFSQSNYKGENWLWWFFHFLGWKQIFRWLWGASLDSWGPHASLDTNLANMWHIISPGVLACATRGGGRSEAGHCFHLLFFFSFFFLLRLLLFTHFGESPVRENLFPPIFWHN